MPFATAGRACGGGGGGAGGDEGVGGGDASTCCATASCPKYDVVQDTVFWTGTVEAVQGSGSKDRSEWTV